MAQVVAETMGAMQDAFVAAAEAGGIDLKTALSAVVNEVFERLQEIATATAEADGENFDPGAVSGNLFTAPDAEDAEAGPPSTTDPRLTMSLSTPTDPPP